MKNENVLTRIYEEQEVAFRENDIRIDEIAILCGWIQTKDNKEYIRWERVNYFLKELGLNICKSGDFISFDIMFSLLDKSENTNKYKFKELALETLNQYRLEIVNALNWFYSNKNDFIKGEKFIIINAGDNVKDSMIGTLCGIISNSNVYSKDFVVVGMAYTPDEDIKISMRTNMGDIDLREIIKKVANGGGHSNACGAFIKRKQEEKFISDMKDALTVVS